MFYGFVRFVVRVFFRLYFRWEVYGSQHLPPTGGVILASNHVSYLDPPLMGCAVDRPVHFMGKKELFGIPILSRVFRWLYAFPVERNGADRKAIRQALSILNSGEVLGIFPEGTRGDGSALLKPQPGTVLLALRSGAPIVPMAIVCPHYGHGHYGCSRPQSHSGGRQSVAPRQAISSPGESQDLYRGSNSSAYCP